MPIRIREHQPSRERRSGGVAPTGKRGERHREHHRKRLEPLRKRLEHPRKRLEPLRKRLEPLRKRLEHPRQLLEARPQLDPSLQLEARIWHFP